MQEEEADDDDDGVVWMTDTSAEAARKRAEEQLSAATAAMVTVGNIEAEQEEARKKAEREAKKKAEAEEAERKRLEEVRLEQGEGKGLRCWRLRVLGDAVGQGACKVLRLPGCGGIGMLVLTAPTALECAQDTCSSQRCRPASPCVALCHKSPEHSPYPPVPTPPAGGGAPCRGGSGQAGG